MAGHRGIVSETADSKTELDSTYDSTHLKLYRLSVRGYCLCFSLQ